MDDCFYYNIFRLKIFVGVILIICVIGLRSSVHLLDKQNKIKETIDPCDDFYDYACSVPDNLPAPFHTRQEDAMNAIKHSIEPYMKKTVEFYQSCKKFENIWEENMRRIVKDFKAIDNVCLFPDNETVDMSALMIEIWRLRGIEPFFGIDFTQEHGVKSQIKLSVPTIMLFYDKLSKNYRKTTFDQFDYLSSKFNYIVENNTIRKALELEKQIHTILYGSEHTPFLAKMSEMVEDIPSINIKRWLSTDEDPVLLRILDDNPVIKSTLGRGYFTKLEAAFWTADETTWKAFMKLLILRNPLEYMTFWSNYNTSLDYARKCEFQATYNFPLAIGRAYLDYYFDKGIQPKILEITNEIVHAFKDHFFQNTWMNQLTVNKTLFKLEKAQWYLGESDAYLGKSSIQSYYKAIKWESDDFIERHIYMRKFNIRRVFYLIGDEVPIWTYWYTKYFDINAFYMPKLNSLFIPAMYFHMGGYRLNTPSHHWYGCYGWSVAHEIGHSFDNYSHAYDSNGKTNPWFTKNDERIYQEKMNCLIEQYNNYTLKTLGYSIGGRTLDENVADNIGIKIAYYAFMNHIEKLPYMSNHPVLNQEQLFFLSFARARCNNISEWSVLETHAPPNSRVNVPLQNMPEFSSTFNCPIGSPMNPEQKCTIFF